MTQQRVSPITLTSTLPAVATLSLQGALGQSADIVQLKASTGTTLASTTATGVNLVQQPTPTAKTATATLTIAELLTGIVTVTSATAVTLTLPTGTLSDAGFFTIGNDLAVDWSVINLGSASGAVTMSGGTGHTYVGSLTIAIATSARIRSRRTAANTWVSYRIA